MSGVKGFSPVGQVNEAHFQAMRTEDNLAPKYAPRLLRVLANLGFPSPVVVVGDGREGVPLQLADYLDRGASEEIPVAVVLCWPSINPDVRVTASGAYQAFAADLWQGFGFVAAALYGTQTGELRELAIKLMPELSQAFDSKLREIAERD